VNAVIGSKVAPTGIGAPKTKQNKVYEKILGIGDSNEWFKVSLFDTVGLEIDSSITTNTLKDIKKFMEESYRNSDGSIQVVWFCVSQCCSRFESYEVALIRDLSITYEIPFVIVITQCIGDSQGELEKQIAEDLPEVIVHHVLAEPYTVRGGSIPAFGVDDLLSLTAYQHDKLRVRLLEAKIDALTFRREKRIEELTRRARMCITKSSEAAKKIAFIPGACIPFVHGICIKMLVEINQALGINSSKDAAEEVFTSALLGIIATPVMVVPLLSIPVAQAYVETIGETYLDCLVNVIEKSSDAELKDITLLSKRIKEELRRK